MRKKRWRRPTFPLAVDHCTGRICGWHRERGILRCAFGNFLPGPELQGEAPRLGLAVFLIRPAGWCIAPCLCPLRLYFWALLVCFPPRPIPCFGWHWWPFSLCGLLPPLNWDDGHHRPLVCLGVPWPSRLTCGQTGKRFSCQWAGTTPISQATFQNKGRRHLRKRHHP